MNDASVADRTVRVTLENCAPDDTAAGPLRLSSSFRLSASTVGGFTCSFSRPTDLVAGSNVNFELVMFGSNLPQQLTWTVDASLVLPGGYNSDSTRAVSTVTTNTVPPRIAPSGDRDNAMMSSVHAIGTANLGTAAYRQGTVNFSLSGLAGTRGILTVLMPTMSYTAER